MTGHDRFAFFVKRVVLVWGFAVSCCIYFNQMIALSGLIDMSEGYQEALDMMKSLSVAQLFILASVIAPIIEEVSFRGLMFGLPLLIIRKVRKRCPLPVTIILAVVSSVIFGIYHGNIVQFFYATVMGLCMCLVFESCGGLLWSIFFHMTANTSSLLTGMIPGIDTKPGMVISGVIALFYAVWTGYELIFLLKERYAGEKNEYYQE